ncbi:MAG TPA: hypothetical protein VME40_02725 [Caulobacteraceae bacterium]|nr:hypothetical protein [Caulobacteraceae bacterium]
MHRLLIAAATAAFLAATAAPALAEDYPPCSKTVTDHCRVVPMKAHHHVVHHHAKPKPKDDKGK